MQGALGRLFVKRCVRIPAVPGECKFDVSCQGWELQCFKTASSLTVAPGVRCPEQRSPAKLCWKKQYLVAVRDQAAPGSRCWQQPGLRIGVFSSGTPSSRNSR